MKALLISVFFLFFVSFSTLAKQYSSKVMPAGWVNEFSYNGSLHCRQVKWLMSENGVRGAFQSAQIVMLNYLKYKALIGSNKGENNKDQARSKVPKRSGLTLFATPIWFISESLWLGYGFSPRWD